MGIKRAYALSMAIFFCFIAFSLFSLTQDTGLKQPDSYIWLCEK